MTKRQGSTPPECKAGKERTVAEQKKCSFAGFDHTKEWHQEEPHVHSFPQERYIPAMEDKIDEYKSCTTMNETCKSGGEVCQPDHCMMCRNGVWEQEQIA